VPLTLNGTGSASAAGVDLSNLAPGAAEVRVLNPGRLVSNAATLLVSDTFVLRTVSPAGVRQDQAALDLALTGAGFAAGISATIAAPGGSGQTLPTTWIGPADARVVGFDPASLAIGDYDLTVANPGTSASAPIKFSITEGTPVLSSVTPTCIVPGAGFVGSVTGALLYPRSVVRVTGASIVDSPLDTACLAGTDALGRCAGGQLRISADLSSISAGTYTVTVVNPGSPAPLRSASQSVTVKASCP
jgi:hypothetical protein